MKTFTAILSLALLTGTAHANICTENEATAADLAVDNLSNWKAIYDNYTAYKQCDDGSIAEGNSEAIARMFADKWKETGKLQSLIDRDSTFEEYVLRHIDSTLDTNDLTQIAKLSSHSCPTSNKPFCSKLFSAVQAVEKQD
ncbi:hypothetical protein KWG64_22580 [Rahnella sp. PD12R]|uniref:hypothetical protein n=1 Tax=Rahnella sp. PD12R TaxID=2855688 RepID=UPI001C43C874|nr:hypothetical protein [Rahnella sp. PD12R]MBV6820734.1 hypothetical protein [Rahnella sp. PD12R]